MKIYIVQSGDTFHKIANEQNVDLDVLIRANPQIGKIDMILPGMKIKLPQQRKHVRNNMNKNLPKHKRMESPDITGDSCHMPIIEEDDTWNVRYPLPERIEHNSMKYKMDPPIKKREKSKGVRGVNGSPYSIRHNPISDIRNTREYT